MPESLVSFSSQLMYVFSHMTAIHVLDIILVALIFFVVFQALHQTRALQILRGVIVVGILGGALLVLLPLDTLNWLVRVLLVAGIIGLPLLFQDELRRILIGIGRFRLRRGYSTDFERFRNALETAVWQLAERGEGALIVLEGQDPLENVIATGIPLQAETVTSELLLTIFNPNTPLHDGAVVLRGDRLAAASCILPVQTESTGETHLGTRHRAALGLTHQAPDALVIVVSEETGRVSVANGGHLYPGLSPEQLTERLNQFGEQFGSNGGSSWGWLRGRGVWSTLTNLLVAVLLALIAWVSVTFQTNPPAQATIENVPVVVNAADQGLVLMNEIPDFVRVRVQATKDRVDSLGPESIRADLDLSGLPAGPHTLQILASASDPYVQILQVRPATASILLEPLVTKIFTPTAVIPDLAQLPPGYVVGEITLSPDFVSVTGPQSEVQQVKDVRVEIPLNGRRAEFQQSVAVQLLDERGQPVAGLQPVPAEVLATVPVRRTFFTREVSVQAVLDKSQLDRNYEVKRVQVTPPQVTLVGARPALDSAGDFLVTAPISLTGVYSDLTLDVPLILPADVAALNEQGETVNNVQVQVSVSPISDYLVIERPVVMVSQPMTGTARLAPTRVTVLVIGPRPVLDEIRLNPDLIIVSVDVSGLPVGIHTLALEVQAPPGVQTLLFPAEIQVTVEQ